MNSNDHKCPFYCIWPKVNTKEWVAYEFSKPETVSNAKVYWFDDGPWGGCRIPVSWTIQYQDASGNWLDVKAAVPAVAIKDAYSEFKFDQVTTKAIRVAYQTEEKNSAGIYEIMVN
jgi:hypothetical protein